MKAINLKDWEVNATLAGRKSQLLVPVKPQPEILREGVTENGCPYLDVSFGGYISKAGGGRKVTLNDLWEGWAEDRIAAGHCPFTVGARLKVKETWAVHKRHSTMPCKASAFDCVELVIKEGYDLLYKATSHIDPDYPVYWRSARTMPRNFSRLSLEVTAVGIIRLQDVNELDATSLSIRDAVRQFTEMQMELWCKYTKILDPQASVTNNRAAVGVVWDSKHKGTDLAWEHSPWVWAVDYTVVEKGDSKNGQSD
jgi:hypothetical protein